MVSRNYRSKVVAEDTLSPHLLALKIEIDLLSISFDLMFKEFPKVHLLKIFPLDELESQNDTQYGHAEKVCINSGFDQSKSTRYKKES